MNDWPLTLFLISMFLISGIFCMAVGAFFHWVCKAIFREDDRRLGDDYEPK